MISNFLQKNKNVCVGERERLVSKSLLGKYKNTHEMNVWMCLVYVDFGINNNFFL
jgi:hypothetical protein